MDGHPSRPPVPRRLERRTRFLGGPRQRDLLRLAPNGVWRATVSPRRWWALTPPFHPYRSCDRRSPLCSTFRRLSPPGVSPASCPAVSGLSSDARGRPRPSGLHTATRGGRSTAPGHDERSPSRTRGQHDLGHLPSVREQRAALGAGEDAAEAHDELAAAQALEARAAREREQLLVERPREGCDGGAHRRLRNTPTTLPRTRT